MKNNHKESIVYWIDEKLYLNITNKCSNSCIFCIKNYRKGLSGFKLTLSEEPTNIQVIEAIREVINTKNWREIVFCGFGEPTERLDLLLQVTRWIKQHYGKPILFRVNTNGQGYILNPNREVAKELKKAGIDKVSVSLNASNQ
jgi:TatD family-associated radical SAM protein